MTYDELYAQCLAENPVQIQTINDVQRELSETERCEACENWAKMRLAQIQYERNNG